MKKNIVKITSAFLAAVVTIGTVAGVAYAKETSVETVNEEENLVTSDTEDVSENDVSAKDLSSNDLVNDLKDKLSEETITINDEVVYVFANTDGSVKKVMDSIWMENGSEKEVTENTNLPLDVKITYTLDGKKVSADKLNGANGHIKVKYEFTNNAYEMREINGRERKVYVPFLVSVMGVFDGEKFENLSVSTGKIVDDGTRYAAVGLAFPGLSDDLSLSQDAANDFNVPSTIEFEADAKDCELNGMYLLVSNNVFSELNSENSDKMEELKENLSKVTDAVNELLDGSDALYEGLGTLYTGTTKVGDGVTALSDGLVTIDSNSQALVDGAKEVFESLLAQASKQMKESGISVGNLTIDGYHDVLVRVIGEGYVSNVATEKVNAEVEKNRGTVEAAVVNGVRAEVRKQVEAGARQQVEGLVVQGMAAQFGISEDEVRNDYQDAVNSQVEAVMATKEADIDAAVEANMQSPEVQAKISALTEGNIKDLKDTNISAAVKSGNQTISDLIESLDKYNTFYQGIIAYTNGVNTASQGALELKNAMPELLKGVKALKDGAGEMSDGLKTFDEEITGKLSEITDDTLEGMVDRLNVIADVSKNYNAYDKESKANKDSVKFIINVDSAK